MYWWLDVGWRRLGYRRLWDIGRRRGFDGGGFVVRGGFGGFVGGRRFGGFRGEMRRFVLGGGRTVGRGVVAVACEGGEKGGEVEEEEEGEGKGEVSHVFCE